MTANIGFLTPYLRRLQDEVSKLRFGENFQPSFEWEGTILAGETQLIKNPLNFPPKRRIIMRQSSSLICDGDTWTSSYVSLENEDVVDATVLVVFYGY